MGFNLAFKGLNKLQCGEHGQQSQVNISRKWKS